MFHRLLAPALAAVLSTLPLAAANQRAVLDDLLHVLPKSAEWETWLEKSGELPPDFTALPSVPFLPDPLRSRSGEMIRSGRAWTTRRAELLKLFEHYVTGTVPQPPGNVRAAEITSRQEAETRVKQVLLEFGPDHRAKLHMELIVPEGPGPFPVFITQDNHRRWALIAASRGYIACVYAGADSNDDTGQWVDIWPEYDWTKLTRRAWAASRCIDFLYSLPQVDRTRIALTGHSRNGKTSIIGAAFDERINAVISSSSGAGGSCSFRFFSEREAAEGIEFITRKFPDWLHPRLRFFAGREEKLPIDMPELIACIAPRPFLFSTAMNDSVESIWAIEQSYYNARRTYDLLKSGDAIELLYREGSHGTDAHDIERYLDWLDGKFGRAKPALASKPMFPTYSQWQALNPEKIDMKQFKAVSSETPRATREQTLKAVQWMLGEKPPQASSIAGAYGSEAEYLSYLLGRGGNITQVAKMPINFGNYVAGTVYYPTNAGKAPDKLPAIVWLHPISVPTGFVPGYRRGDAPQVALARAGFAVFAFDQIGNGGRVEEIKEFYKRYPRWSLLGKTVADTRAAVDALLKVEFVDPKQIWLVGFAQGASASLHAAALDTRIAGVAAVGGFAPMRPALSNRGMPTAAQFQHRYPLVPRLGAFAGQEDHLPYDYRELVEAIGPRPVLLFAPRMDESVDANDLARYYAPIKSADYTVVDDYNRFGPEMQKIVIDKLKARINARKEVKR